MKSLRVLQLVHGFPPRENAGTEQYALRLSQALIAAGHSAHTVCATRWPGRKMYEVVEEPGVTRIVNNAPYAGVRRAENDLVIRQIIERKIRTFHPDLVHVQHAMFLDTGFASAAPVVWTLHDAWGWCAAGGQLVRRDLPALDACSGPGAACAGCASAWVQDGAGTAALLTAASRLSSLVSGPTLHRAWQHVPAPIRARVTKSNAPLSTDQVAARAQRLREFAARCASLVAPSRYYADLATQNGFPSPTVIGHGVTANRSGPDRDGPLICVGTIVPHKGPLRAAEAWRKSGLERRIELWGPAGPDPKYVRAVEETGFWRGECTDIPALFARSRALVVGAIWPENAPLIVLEARAAGIPVLAPRIGGLPEIVQPGRDGELFDPNDEADFIHGMQKISDAEYPEISPPPTFHEHVARLLAHYAALLRSE